MTAARCLVIGFMFHLALMRVCADQENVVREEANSRFNDVKIDFEYGS